MKDVLRVLLVEDSPTDAKLVLGALSRGGRKVEHVRVDEPVAMRAALEKKKWDVVLSDWSMPRFSALAALELLKASGRDLPFLIVSGTIGEESAVDAMRAGAHDYVLKDNLARLAPAVEREVREHAERTARRHAEEALHESEARYRRIVETTSEGVWLTDGDAKLTFVNGRIAAMLGYERTELVGRSILDLMHEQSRASVAALVADRRAEVSGRDERALLRKDGAIVWATFRSTPVYDEAGRYEGRLAMITDVTEQRQATEALRLSQARFARLAEAGIIGISITRDDGPILEANDTFLAMLGFTREDLAAGALDWKKLTPAEWTDTSADISAGLQRSSRSPPREKEYFRKDGTRVPVLVGVASLEPPYAIAVAVDLTERKKTEATLQATENQLRHAQKMEAMGRLAGGVAHDFNNVLSVILSCGDMMLDELEPGDAMRADVVEIRKAGLRAASLTRQLLVFSRQQILAPRVVDMNEIVSGMGKMLQRILGEDVEMVFLAAPGAVRVRADPSSVEQVIMNLVVNARDAMPTGGKLTLETANVELDDEFARSLPGIEAGPHVVLAVTDNGIGMDAATQARIFEPFFTTKSSDKGTGLGLSTVFGIVRQSGGGVWVHSEPKRGTTFKVYLPRVDGDVDDVAPTSDESGPARGTETILLVDDDDQVRVVASGILRRSGYQVLEARHAGEAILSSEQHAGPIHLLVTDVVMPQMSGPELAKRLAKTRDDMRVICMSGYTDDSVVRHGVVESGVAYLQKPFTLESLTRKVRDVLDGRVGG